MINKNDVIQRSGTPEVEVHKEVEVSEVQREPETTSKQSATSLK
jgi:hypothetical protein